MIVNLVPAPNRFLIKKVEETDPIYQKKKEIIHVVQLETPREEEKVSDIWTVLAVGSEIKNYKVGDLVIKHNFQTGGLVRYASEFYLIVTEADILCKLEVVDATVDELVAPERMN